MDIHAQQFFLGALLPLVSANSWLGSDESLPGL
jgi:hypothetical protein